MVTSRRQKGGGATTMRLMRAVGALAAVAVVAAANNARLAHDGKPLGSPQVLSDAAPFPTTFPPHPRLIATPGKIKSLLEVLESDAEAAHQFQKLLVQGTELLTEPPVVQPPPGPSGILTTVRAVVGRVMTLGLLHLLFRANSSDENGSGLGSGLPTTWTTTATSSSTTTTQWATRGIQEMHAFANFTSWNPPHFLDTAEGTFAMAVGLDWFDDSLQDDERTAFQDVLAHYGLVEGDKVFNGTSQYKWWASSPSNWNQVCSGGLAVGALALGDVPRHVELAKRNFEGALTALPISVGYWAPKGAWWEGDSYTGYAAKYLTAALASFETAGVAPSSGGLDLTGVESIGHWLLDSMGPSGKFFDWADGSVHAGSEAAANAMYLGQRFNDSLSSYLGRRFLNTTNASDTWGSLAFALVYWSSAGSFDDVNALPASADYRERFVGMLRSKWTPIPTIDDNQPTTRNATFVAFKGGNQTWNHGHLDQGSFVVDIQGTRWAEDLGSGSYALPGYFGSDRWKYYRTNSTGHNVLQFDGENQALTAVSPISVNITGNFGTANLSEAYAQHADTVIRGYALTVDPDGTDRVIITDEIHAVSGAEKLTWQMHVLADRHAVITSPRTAEMGNIVFTVLNTSSKVTAEDMCPGATLSLVQPEVAPPQTSLSEFEKLVITAPALTCQHLAVSMAATPPTSGFIVHPPSEWHVTGPTSSKL